MNWDATLGIGVVAVGPVYRLSSGLLYEVRILMKLCEVRLRGAVVPAEARRVGGSTLHEGPTLAKGVIRIVVVFHGHDCIIVNDLL